jgi:cephalosporin hydroxylase
MKHFYENILGYTYPQNLIFFDMVIPTLPNNSTWVELGSWTGKSAAYCVVELYNANKLGKFFCVDTWEGSYRHHNAEQDYVLPHAIKNIDDVYDMFKQNTHSISDKITEMKMLSWKAADQFDDESVDFVYVDADHRYESVIKDLSAWWPKVKTGSYFGGDDFTKGHPDVVRATRDFFKDKNRKVKKKGRCWYVQKV